MKMILQGWSAALAALLAGVLALYSAQVEAFSSGERVKAGVEKDHYPFSFFSAKHKAVEGFNVELTRRICEHLKVRCAIVTLETDRLLEELENGNLSFAVAGFTQNPQVEERIDFSRPYYEAHSILIAKDPEIVYLDADKLDSMNVGCKSFSVECGILDERLKEQKLEALTVYDNYERLFKGLYLDEVNAIYIDNLSGFSGMRHNFQRALYAMINSNTISEDSHPMYVGLPKDNPALKEQIDEALNKVIRDGSLYKLSLDYFPYHNFIIR